MRRNNYGGKTEFIAKFILRLFSFFLQVVGISASYIKFQPVYHGSDTVSFFQENKTRFYC